ncbi:hypothetical protein CC79DRAFT_1324326 [Sarocladium strictum]
MSLPAHRLGPTVLATAFTLTGLSTVVIALRFYCRAALMKSVKVYDYLIGGALPNAKPGEYLEGTLKSWYVYQLVYLVDLAAVKFSILFFYRAISSTRAYRVSVYAVMFLVGAFTISMIFVNAFECKTPSDAWSVEILLQGKGSCTDLHPIYYGQAAFNIASDLAILVLPMPVVWNLQMKQQKRLAVIGIFSIGSIAVLASIIRIYALYLWSSDPDVPYNGARILLWSQIEINTALISSSIPALKPLFKFAGGFTTAKSNGYYVRYGDPRSYNTPGSKMQKSHITVTSDQYPIDDDDNKYLEQGRGVPLGTMRPQPTSPPEYVVTEAGAPNDSIARNNSSTVTAGRWNKSKLRQITSDASSDEQELTRFSEESQHVGGSDRRYQNSRNTAIMRTVEVEVRRDLK